VFPLHAASGVGYGEGFESNAHRRAPDGWLPAVKYLIEAIGADVNARDHDGDNALHHDAFEMTSCAGYPSTSTPMPRHTSITSSAVQPPHSASSPSLLASAELPVIESTPRRQFNDALRYSTDVPDGWLA